MSGDAFVIGDGLVVDERTLSEIGGGDDDAAGVLAVGSAGDVVGGCGGLECGDGFDGDWRLGKQSEELREFGLHLSDGVAEVLEDLLGGGGDVFGISFERGAK